MKIIGVNNQIDFTTGKAILTMTVEAVGQIFPVPIPEDVFMRLAEIADHSIQHKTQPTQDQLIEKRAQELAAQIEYNRQQLQAGRNIPAPVPIQMPAPTKTPAPPPVSDLYRRSEQERISQAITQMTPGELVHFEQFVKKQPSPMSSLKEESVDEDGVMSI